MNTAFVYIFFSLLAHFYSKFLWSKVGTAFQGALLRAAPSDMSVSLVVSILSINIYGLNLLNLSDFSRL